MRGRFAADASGDGFFCRGEFEARAWGRGLDGVGGLELPDAGGEFFGSGTSVLG